MVIAKKIRYAVAGLGHIAQVAVLPAFAHAKESCELTALISSDAEKLKELSQHYNISNCYTYDDFSMALTSDSFDAIYIALPNDMHKDFAIRAAEAGKHVLCEKPMALTEADCWQMIKAAEAHNVKLMIAYRLHFEKTNMKAVEIIQAGKIGNPRVFNSSFTMQVNDGNIRTQREHGGGPLYDIGIYCINAARYLFKDEPLEVTALAAQTSDQRFAEIEESIGVVMKFPQERLANFVCSFGSSDISRYEVIGTEGRISLDPAYEYPTELAYTLVQGKHEETHKTLKHDQFAPELLHFAECIIKNEQPRPSGYEGLADIRIIEALQQSVRTGKTVRIEQSLSHPSKPDNDLVQEKPPVVKPHLINVESGSR